LARIICVYLAKDDEPVHVVRIMKYSELGPPPSLQSSNVPPAISVAAPAVRPSIGIPVPVPDAEVSPEQTFATQQEMNAPPPNRSVKVRERAAAR
jgi:hypothetical protein